MTRPLALLAMLVALLAAADALLAAREEEARESRRRLGALFTPEEAAELRKLPALTLELSGERHAYGRVQGRWRCLSYRDAPADGRAIQAWLDALVAAEGVVHSRATDDAPVYGINVPETARVELQGPDATRAPGRDVRVTLELGRALPNGIVFVRRQGTREIWACAGELRAPLATRVAPALPPLLEPSVVPGAWLAEAGGIAALEIERPGGRYTLARRDRALDPATLQPGMLPWTWVLVGADGAERELDAAVAEAYVGLVERLAYVDVLDAAEPAPLVAPLRVTLRGHAGAPLVLALVPDGTGATVRVEPDGTVLRLAPGRAELVAPDPEALARATAEENPWSTVLPTEIPR